MDQSKIKCCCGKPDCAYLQHNSAALESLEKDVNTAARLGQALLGRHESYMAEAEADRARMLAEIENLEKQKREVQAQNAKIIQENKDLLDQLEGLNNIVSESDVHIKALSTSLESVQLEVRRLTAAASRAACLESQLNEMESDQARLEETLAVTQENERSAIQRWRKAEITLRNLHEQVDKIEKESLEERERHAELLERMERRRVVERELDAAAGRLKGAAAATSLGQDKNGTNVVSSFVKDILQDNANLQFNISELRELLQASDEEVQNLRDQLLLHQPLARGQEDSKRRCASTFLSDELQSMQSAPVPQEFHVHHHFHTPMSAATQRKDRNQLPMHRRHKRRRAVFPPTLPESPPKEPAEAFMTAHRTRDSTSSTSTTVFQTPPSSARTYRWLDQTPGPAFSSAPSSPRSVYRASSVFDRSELAFDSSRPTSPESGFTSPLVKMSHRKGPSETSISSVLDERLLDDAQSLSSGAQHSQRLRSRSLSKIDTFAEGDRIAGSNKISLFNGPPILEEHNDGGNAATYYPSDDHVVLPLRSPQLRRSTSHESLLSISGMDIHSSSDYSPKTYTSRSTFVPRTPQRIASAGTIFSCTSPIISRTNVTISKASIGADKSSHFLLSSVVSSAANARNTASVVQAASSESGCSQGSQSISIKRRMGDWVLGKWSSTPSKSTTSHNTADPPEFTRSVSPSPSTSVTGKDFARPLPIRLFRPPGVNQKGPILGLRPPDETPISIHPENVDETLLQESLAE
ncbi:hypothetical protein PRK78_005335 [Emydomyces testavorans]|uniref:Uncharacterized protein n=1 Tax=Emydomyces testavorans TaxID=2070801 RepID=A0AAF0DKB8_9EURO|nr:hypothetical protein PRK78_005335 [Emydomyces testavorans]